MGRLASDDVVRRVEDIADNFHPDVKRDALRSYHAGEGQGLALVHFSAQLKRFMRDRGYIEGLSGGCVGCVRGYCGVSRVYFASEAAQVELKSGRI